MSSLWNLQIDLNLGSSGVVRGVLSLVFGYISALVVDLAFFVRVCRHFLYLHPVWSFWYLNLRMKQTCSSFVYLFILGSAPELHNIIVRMWSKCVRSRVFKPLPKNGSVLIRRLSWKCSFTGFQGETADELPERLIGVGRMSHIQMDKAVELPAS